MWVFEVETKLVVVKAGLKFVSHRSLQLLHLPISQLKVRFWTKRSPNLYFGSIEKRQSQRLDGNFIGLSLKPSHFFEIKCDIANGDLPFPSSSISKIQAEDVLEHINFDDLPKVFDEIFRVLRPGGVFRLSVPDYNSIVLKKRSIYDFEGRVIADPLTGSSVYYDFTSEETLVKHGLDGNSHMWFPTKDLVDELIQKSGLRFCDSIKFWHYNLSTGDYLVENFPNLFMPVFRCPPKDMRANGLPISIIVDFTK
jgi:SAM-dependent methyltransferase